MTNKKGRLSEDKVRDLAKKTLGLYDTETAQSGVGQLTSFNHLVDKTE